MQSVLRGWGWFFQQQQQQIQWINRSVSDAMHRLRSARAMDSNYLRDHCWFVYCGILRSSKQDMDIIP